MAQPVLRTLKRGDTATIVAILGAQVTAKRLADMGFVNGAMVEMLRPGAPCIIRLHGTCIALGAVYQASIQLAEATARPADPQSVNRE